MLIGIPVLGVVGGALILLGVAGGGSKNDVVATPTTHTSLAATTTTPAGAAPSTTRPIRAPTAAAPTTATTRKVPTGVTFKVTGAGTSMAISVTIIGDAQEQQHRSAALPYTLTVPDNHRTYGLTAQSASSRRTGSITCEIDQPNHAPVIRTSTGAYAVVDCIGASG